MCYLPLRFAMFNGCACITIWAHLLIAIAFANVLFTAEYKRWPVFLLERSLVNSCAAHTHGIDWGMDGYTHAGYIIHSQDLRRYQTLNAFKKNIQHILEDSNIKECCLKQRLHLKTYCIWTMLTDLLTYLKVYSYIQKTEEKILNVKLFQDISWCCCFCC